MDWHQTGLYVVISVYAKKYQPNQSSVKLNPIRLSVDLFFLENDSRYNLDIELRGVCLLFLCLIIYVDEHNLGERIINRFVINVIVFYFILSDCRCATK